MDVEREGYPAAGPVLPRLGGVLALTLGGHGCYLGTTLLLMRDLGPQRYGFLAFALAGLAYMAVVGNLGLRPVVLREVARDPAGTGRALLTYALLTGCCWLVSVAGCVGSALTAGLCASEVAAVGLVAAGSLASFATLQPFLDAHGRQVAGAAAGLGVDAAALAAAAALSAGGRLDLVAAAALAAGKGLATALLWTCLLRDACRGQRWDVGAGYARRLMLSAWPLLAAAALGALPAALGAYAVLHHAGRPGSALWAVGAQAASAYLLLVVAAGRVVQPALADPARLTRRAAGVLLAAHALVALALLVGVMAAGVAVTELVLGPFYRPALVPMAVLLAGAFGQGLVQAAGWCLVAVGDERSVLLGYAAGVPVCAGGCLALVPPLGVVGAATAVAAGHAAAAAVVVARARGRFWPRVPAG